MNDFVEILKSKRDDARKRMESARTELDTWEAALKLELERNNSSPIAEVPALEHSPPVLQLSATARNKQEIMRDILRKIGRPARAAEIVEKVVPIISRSHVFAVLAEMVESGEVEKKGMKYRYVGNEGEEKEQQVGAVQ